MSALFASSGGVGTTQNMEKHVDVASSAEPSITSDKDRDDLIRLGKDPVLKRNFGFWSIVGFTCTVLITWEGTLISFTLGLTNGGPAGIVYGFIFTWIGTLATFSTLSELVSMAPTSGGQYHWVSMLAPRKSAKFLSYITGWLTLAGWQGTVASGSYLTGTLIQAMIALCNPSYEGTGWQSTLLAYAVLAFALFINTLASSLLPKFEGLVLILHVVGFIAILIPLVVLAPHSSAEVALNTWNNGGNWPTQGLSFFVGLIGIVFAFAGVDGAFHMAEEIHNPRTVIPNSIVLSVMLNGVMGFAMVIAVLFCMGDVTASTSLYPVVDIFQQATKSVAGTAVMTSIITVLAISATTGIMASTSRLFWALARDRGLPGWRALMKINKHTGNPLLAVGVSTLIAALLALIAIGSAVAFNDVISVSVSGLYSSYLICAALLLWRRLTGGISVTPTSPMEVVETPGLINTEGAQIFWGPWRIPGIWGIFNNIVSCVYLTIVLFFSFWPPVTPVNAASLNYSVICTGAVMILSLIYYLFWGRHQWKGPVIEVTMRG